MRNMITEEEKLDLIRPAYRKGVAEGVQKGKMDVAQKMMELNLPLETIIQVTGLPLDTIKALMP